MQASANISVPPPRATKLLFSSTFPPNRLKGLICCFNEKFLFLCLYTHLAGAISAYYINSPFRTIAYTSPSQSAQLDKEDEFSDTLPLLNVPIAWLQAMAAIRHVNLLEIPRLIDVLEADGRSIMPI